MRNAKMDLAKRQAVGIYRAASPRAAINRGVTICSGGDYRRPEASKDCYLNKAADRALIEAYQGPITICKPFKNSRGTTVRCNELNKVRSGACPQNRSDLLPGRADRVAPGLLTPPRKSDAPQSAKLARLKASKVAELCPSVGNVCR